MRWTAEAEAAIKKVPFFVRKKSRGGKRFAELLTDADVDALMNGINNRP
ncbi:hypothetical protein [uncultured Desulfosarcina sp.]|nr:hypothetical protein [uncultured Desulfosarcina sp.]